MLIGCHRAKLQTRRLVAGRLALRPPPLPSLISLSLSLPLFVTPTPPFLVLSLSLSLARSLTRSLFTLPPRRLAASLSRAGERSSSVRASVPSPPPHPSSTAVGAGWLATAAAQWKLSGVAGSWGGGKRQPTGRSHSLGVAPSLS